MLRRPLLGLGLGVGLLPLLGARALAAPAAIDFKVMREGREVGTHTVRFRDDGDLLRVRTEMRIIVRLAGFTVFRFTQDTEEAWRGERLVGLESRADRNGRPGACQAMAEGNAIRLRGSSGEALLPANAAPLTWWRAATLQTGVPLFDVREGRPVEPRLERRAEAGGQRIRLVGGEGAEVVYDAAGRWVGFATTGEDGSTVTYARA
jgi:hypothetical protein